MVLITHFSTPSKKASALILRRCRLPRYSFKNLTLLTQFVTCCTLGETVHGNVSPNIVRLFMRRKSTTIRDVAKRAGVGVSTVSYVLNGHDQHVSATTREHILAAA